MHCVVRHRNINQQMFPSPIAAYIFLLFASGGAESRASGGLGAVVTATVAVPSGGEEEQYSVEAYPMAPLEAEASVAFP
jgi:hypothetical protein